MKKRLFFAYEENEKLSSEMTEDLIKEFEGSGVDMGRVTVKCSWVGLKGFVVKN